VIGLGKTLGHAEVQDFYLAGRSEHDVFRLNVAVHNSLLVRGAKSLGALGGNLKKFSQGHRPGETPPQGFSLHELHYQESFAVVFDYVVERGHMRICKAGNPLSLLLEAAPATRVVAQAGSQALERDGAFQFCIFRAVNFAHPAFTQAVGDQESTCNDSGERVGRIRGCGPEFRHCGPPLAAGTGTNQDAGAAEPPLLWGNITPMQLRRQCGAPLPRNAKFNNGKGLTSQPSELWSATFARGPVLSFGANEPTD